MTGKKAASKAKLATSADLRSSARPAISTRPRSSSKTTVSATPGSATPTGAAATLQLPAGAEPSALPATLTPQLATLVATAPADAGWIYEIKFDGYRLLARLDGGEVRLYTRNGNDWTAKLKSLARDLQQLGLAPCWLDGEIVVVGANGAPDFNALQNGFDAARTEAIQYYVFDLPFHAGHDLRQVPLVERRALLATLIGGDGTPPGRIRFSQDFQASPDDLLQNACRMRLEGVIGKRADSPYVSRRSPAWIKLKCTQRQEFVVGGYTDPQGARTGIGSLLLGIHDEAGHLRFAGGVGSGFDEETLGMLKAKLDALGADTTPFFEKPREVRGHWVRPELVAEVSFGEWTKDGRVRHAVFHGLRTDKPAAAITREQAESAAEVTREVAAEAKASGVAGPSKGRAAKERAGTGAAAAPAARQPARAKKADAPSAEALGVRISNPDRVIDPSSGATKLDLVNYYLSVAKLILPHLVKRPVSLVRAPAGLDGQLFFQRHAEALKIPELKKLDTAIMPGKPALVEVDSFTALIGAAQMNVVELHTWNATTRAIMKPDRMIFDLDPGEGLGWEQVREAAALTRTLLTELGLESFLKTSGGKGLHVVVPLTPRDDWDTVKDVSKAIVEHMATVIPERFVAKSGPKNRVGRIFVDYLRNGFGATTACAFSARARPGVGVSIPCAWDELGDLSGGAHWTIRNVHDRLEEPTDPWAGYAGTRQTLVGAMKILGVAPVAAG